MAFPTQLFNAATLGSLWGKLKGALLVVAVTFMLWQGFQMTSLQKDVSRLETTQASLQQQVEQVENNYKKLSDIYKQTNKTSSQYIESVKDLSGKSTALEKSFAELERETARASANASKALTMQTSTSARGDDEKRTTELSGALPEGMSGSAADVDLKWRKLLDDTFCTVHPDKCVQ
jgi:chromosome segregation ATPase